MADPVDRVFVHALSTLKKMPKTGAARPPPADRLRLYGLYKQAREGDVEDVMARPGPDEATWISPEGLQRERDKWDAWHSQHGVGRTEAKHRYIEALIETMDRYATTAEARELATGLEFVWDQAKNGGGTPVGEKYHDIVAFRMLATADAMSERERIDTAPLLGPKGRRGDGGSDRSGMSGVSGGSGGGGGNSGRDRRVERALMELSDEVAALREQAAAAASAAAASAASAANEERRRRRRSLASWILWAIWAALRHATIDLAALALLLVWMRRRGDRRLEDLVRAAAGLGQEYARRMLW